MARASRAFSTPVGRAARPDDHRVERHCRPGTGSSRRALAARVEERIGEVLGIGVVGVPVAEKEIGLAVPDGGAHAGSVALDDLDPDAERLEILLHRLRHPRELGALAAPELQLEPVGDSRLGQQPPGAALFQGYGARVESYPSMPGGWRPRNVVPSEAGVWYYFRELDYPHIKALYDLGNTMAEAATMMTGTTVTRRVVGSAWPPHFNKVVAEIQQKNIERVGMPQWSDADQTLAKALQKEIGQPADGLKDKVDELKPPSPDTEPGGSDDVGDISWVVPMVYMRYPANIPHTPGHSWVDAVAMATPDCAQRIDGRGESAGHDRA